MSEKAFYESRAPAPPSYEHPAQRQHAPVELSSDTEIGVSSQPVPGITETDTTRRAPESWAPPTYENQTNAPVAEQHLQQYSAPTESNYGLEPPSPLPPQNISSAGTVPSRQPSAPWSPASYDRPTDIPISEQPVQQNGAPVTLQPAVQSQTPQQNIDIAGTGTTRQGPEAWNPSPQMYPPQPYPPVQTNQYPTAFPLHALHKQSQVVDCPVCHQREMTRVEAVNGKTTHGWAAVLCFCICLGCIPYMMAAFKDMEHSCGKCGHLLAVYHGSGHVEVVHQEVKRDSKKQEK